MTSMSDAVSRLQVTHRDDVAIAVSVHLSPDVAANLARAIEQRLRDAAVPLNQRTWIIASSGDDESAARTIAAISDFTEGARVIVHDARDPDGLIFQRRIPGQPRGGIYLNAAWQSASVRIACGDADAVVVGVAAWFNATELVGAKDLMADLVMS